jgi:hypothetical protein
MVVIQEGYVFCTPDGDFLNVNFVSTHCGYRATVSIAKSLETANIYPHCNMRSISNIDPRGAQEIINRKYPAAKFLPVKVTRVVELLGFGVKD